MQRIHIYLKYAIAAVWLANGFFCKVLNLVPRHERIVARILGETHSGLFTICIGVAETLMAIWIFSGKYSRLNAVIQIFVIALMNLLEYFQVPDLLLWGRTNAIFAALFICLIGYNEFILNKKQIQPA